MALAESLPPDASTASTGLGLRYIGTDPAFAYAYSGVIALDNTTNENTYLEFISGSGLIVGKFFCNNFDTGAGTDDMFHQVYFNDIVIQGYRSSNAGPYTEPDNTMPVIIPPFTLVKVTIYDLTQASTIANVVSFTGRVYDL